MKPWGNLTCLLIAGFVALSAPVAARPRFMVGQMWSLKSTATTGAKVVVGRIEPWHGKIVIHVSIVDIPIPKGFPGAGAQVRIDHMPFDSAALAQSVGHVIATGKSVPPNFEVGYAKWKSDPKAGIYSISVTGAVATVFSTFASHR